MPMTVLRHIPNLLTVLRCVLTAPLAIALAERQYAEALALFVIAGASDGLDGYLAKRFGWQSRFGAILDPLADKLLLLIGFGMLTLGEVLPLWLFVLVLGRDLVIVIGALLYHKLVGPYPMQPTLLSKANTLLQILLLGLVLFTLSIMPVPATALAVGMAIIAFTTILSGLDYIWTWGRRCLAERRKRRQPLA